MEGATGWGDWLTVGVIGALVGAGELIARYRDHPLRGLRTVPAALYLGLNIAAAMATLWLVRAFDVTFGVDANGGPAVHVVQVLASGFAAMAVLRTSVFNVPTPDGDVGIGPQALLSAISSASDRAIDRKRALDRAKIVNEVMPSVSFPNASTSLPAYCFQLMQNTSADEEATVAAILKQLTANEELPANVKSRILGLVLLTIVGEKVLTRAVSDLHEVLSD